ncbi:hypothetical protein [Mucilaginibacter paludis]|uniref:Uncharacterized protein n=1 Tax=Mucilaginibacter paludis DSM 18603 TaxID=714943 RepID=H1Y3U3_9SPHI|nr:hypothetical protein [Mucilaginibacter paludis]EHQ30355.1 hypothetical protein Mucpa_6299 [Mucilaginibacter paludis DSM 18603]
MQYAQAQNKKLSESTGFIIYTGEDIVPMQVLFIPAKIEETLEKTIEINFNGKTVNMAYSLFFVQIGRILPNLSEVMQKISYMPAKYGLIENPAKICIGKFVFDLSYAENKDPDTPEDTTIHSTVINISGRTYQLKVMDWPDANGAPKLFIKLP